MNLQQITRLDRLQCLSRLQGRQRAFQSGEIESCRSHAPTQAKPVAIVNGEPMERLATISYYFAKAGNTGNFSTSRASCWMMTVAFRFDAIFLMRSIEATVWARS